MMKGLFLYPPSADPTLPPLALARIASVARKCGFDLHFSDENIRFIRWVLLKVQNRNVSKVLEQKLEYYKKAYRENKKSPNSKERTEKVHSALLHSRHLDRHIKEALSVLKSPERFFKITDYLWAYKRIQEAFFCFSELYRETEVGYATSKLVYNPEKPDEIADAIKDRKYNPYFDFFSCRTNLYREYHILFISTIYTSQLIPALTIARMVKEENPLIKVVMGGPCASALSDGIMKYFGRIVDAIGKGDGDYLFNKWYEQRGSETLGGSDGKINSTGVNLEKIIEFISKTSGFYAMSGKPDYTIVEKNDYPLPVKVFPLDCTRGCYWKKCTFCAYGFPRAPYRRMPVSDVVGLIEEEKLKRGVEHYFFSVDTVDPVYMKNLADTIIKRGLDIMYYVDLRMEKEFVERGFPELLYKSGCRVVSFGMESCFEPTLRSMNKGVNPRHFSDILRGFSEAGIHINIHIIHGFPGDTESGIKATFEFLEKHKDYITTAGFSRFTLLAGSPLEKLYRNYGINYIYKPAPLSLYYETIYDNERGQSKKDIQGLGRMGDYPPYEDSEKKLLDLFPQVARLTGSTTDYLLYASRYEPSEMKNILEQAVVLLYREA